MNVTHRLSFLENTDSPITKWESDLLGRRAFVDALTRLILSAPTDQSNVIGLYGSWGSGKTSTKDLLLAGLQSAESCKQYVVEFNPWAFSAQESVLAAFYSEVTNTLAGNTATVGIAARLRPLITVSSVGPILLGASSPPPGSWVNVAIAVLMCLEKCASYICDKWATKQSGSMAEAKECLSKELEKLKGTLLIVIDDLDRLTPHQVVTIFQIVRQNLALPKINFLLLMDRPTVLRHLATEKLGADYLDKIVQFDVDLPIVTSDQLSGIFLQGLKTIFGRFWREEFEQRYAEAWRVGLVEVLTSLRTIKRTLQSTKFHMGLFVAGERLEVDPVDLVVLEVLRKHFPRVYSRVAHMLDPVMRALVDVFMRTLRMKTFKEDLTKILANLVDDVEASKKETVTSLMKYLFAPLFGNEFGHFKAEYTKDARVCDPQFFRSYFCLAVPQDQVTQNDVHSLMVSQNNFEELKTVMEKQLEKHTLSKIVERLSKEPETIKPDNVATVLAVLWSIERQLSILDPDATESVITGTSTALAASLLRTRCRPIERVKILLEAADQGKDLRCLAELVNLARLESEQGEHPDFRLIPEHQMADLTTGMLERIRASAADSTLLDRPDSGPLLYQWLELGGQAEVSAWIQQSYKEPRKLVSILRRLLSTGFRSDATGTTITRTLREEEIRRFGISLVEIDNASKAVEIDKLSVLEKHALDQARELLLLQGTTSRV